MLALKDYINIAEQAAKGRWDPRLDATHMVNHAGRHLVSMHEWSWMQRPPAHLDLVADQAWVALPSDFAQLISVDAPNQLESSAVIVTLDVLQSQRTLFDPTLNVWVAIEYPPAASNTAVNPPPRLAIWPTPTANVTGGIIVTYRAGWRDLVTMSDRPAIPSDMEPLFVQVVRSVVLGQLDKDDTTVKRLDAIGESSMLEAAKRRHGMSVPTLGQMGSGHPRIFNEWRPYDVAIRSQD
jgi:hypothetical protein